jgi:diguanylate cyclase
MRIKIKSQREVWSLTAAITAISVMIPAAITFTAFALSPDGLSPSYVKPLMAVAIAIPLFLTPAIAVVLLGALRVQAEMIRTIDARIMYDMLTGVLNRNHFLDNVRAADANGPFLIVDADHFKSINDRYGHAVGDEALRIMAHAIQHSVGKDGYVGRLGGEEFGVFLPGKSPDEGRVCAEAICAAVRGLSPLVIEQPIKLSVSVGCTFHRRTSVIGHSMKVADDLLYRAKEQGRDRVAYDMPKRSQRKAA